MKNASYIVCLIVFLLNAIVTLGNYYFNSQQPTNMQLFGMMSLGITLIICKIDYEH